MALGYQEHSVYRNRLNEFILRTQESGIMNKLLRDVIFDSKKLASGRQQAIGTGTIIITSAEERSLNLADTEGMFIFLGIGFLIAVGALISEWVGGCTNRVMRIMKKRKDDKDEADRVEKDRIEKEEHPSRRPSIFSFLSNKIRTPKTPKTPNSPKSHLSTPIESGSSELSKEALKELYDGPDAKISPMCFYNDAFIHENDLYEAQRVLQEEMERREKSAGSSKSLKFKQISIRAEVNREATPPKAIDTENFFGEEILY